MSGQESTLNLLDYHVLLALAGEPRHGYAIKEAVVVDSEGALQPQAASLYRIIARMISSGLVSEVEPEGPSAPHPGRPRRYYGLTEAGRRSLEREAMRQRSAAALAVERLGLPRGNA